MRELPAILDRVYAGRDRLTRDELYRRAMTAGASLDVVTELYILPDGAYARVDVDRALRGPASALAA